ncbi:MAG: hypoxanthine phosphoribosyltransferase, partial [Ilumatobacter sp.]|nr:hypoxanthine phosphoribosyltransferase [Ilumatobacter sp.]
MTRTHAVHFDAVRIQRAVSEIAQAVDRDAGPDGLVVVTVLKGAAMFSCDLVR